LNKDEIKEFLRDNPTQIEKILEDLGCNRIKTIPNKRVQSTRPPDGDNPTSLQVKLNKSLSSVIHTNNEYNKQEYKDIFSLIEYLQGCKFNQAISYVCKICNLKYDGIDTKQERSSSYDFLKQFKRSISKKQSNLYYEESILNETFIERFIRNECKLFSDDGINELTQNKFGVSYDILDNRVVFPIRNDDGKLLTFKGRTLEENFKIRGIPKYYYYYPYHGEYYLYGLYENYFDILSADEVFVGEAEKFVMQLDSMEINNCLAVSKHSISPIQLNKLLKLGKDIVLTFDKDITLEEIFIECKKFKGLCNVYYIYDNLDLLEKKQSPSDKGKEVFMQLYNNCKFKYEG